MMGSVVVYCVGLVGPGGSRGVQTPAKKTWSGTPFDPGMMFDGERSCRKEHAPVPFWRTDALRPPPAALGFTSPSVN